MKKKEKRLRGTLTLRFRYRGQRWDYQKGCNATVHIEVPGLLHYSELYSPCVSIRDARKERDRARALASVLHCVFMVHTDGPFPSLAE